MFNRPTGDLLDDKYFSQGGEMTIEELKKKLEAAQFPPERYSITGGLPNEALCIEKFDGGFRVYYSERGNRVSLRIFNTESDACDYFVYLGRYSFKIDEKGLLRRS